MFLFEFLEKLFKIIYLYFIFHFKIIRRLKFFYFIFLIEIFIFYFKYFNINIFIPLKRNILYFLKFVIKYLINIEYRKNFFFFIKLIKKCMFLTFFFVQFLIFKVFFIIYYFDYHIIYYTYIREKFITSYEDRISYSWENPLDDVYLESKIPLFICINIMLFLICFLGDNYNFYTNFFKKIFGKRYNILNFIYYFFLTFMTILSIIFYIYLFVVLYRMLLVELQYDIDCMFTFPFCKDLYLYKVTSLDFRMRFLKQVVELDNEKFLLGDGTFHNTDEFKWWLDLIVQNTLSLRGVQVYYDIIIDNQVSKKRMTLRRASEAKALWLKKKYKLDVTGYILLGIPVICLNNDVLYYLYSFLPYLLF